MVDSDHYESLSFTVYPIAPDDVESEETVLAIASGKEGHETRIGDRPQVDIKSEEAFTRSIHYYVIGPSMRTLRTKRKQRLQQRKRFPRQFMLVKIRHQSRRLSMILTAMQDLARCFITAPLSA